MSQIQPVPITPAPGVLNTESPLIAAGRFTNSDGVRWVRGLPQKNGGFVRAVTTPTSGTPRIAHAWRDNQADNFIAVGTYRKLYVYDSGFVQNDITPFISTGTLGNNPFTTVNTSATVTVTHTAHGVNPGDTVIYAGATTFNNVTMNGTFIVQTVIDANSYTITAVTTANASGAGGGNAVTFQYEIPIGTENPAFGLGYGVGGYGLGTYGSPHASSTIVVEPRVWSLDHFGKFLVATYNGGTVYQFDPTQVQPWPRAVKVSGSPPTDCRALFVTPERFVFVLRDNMVVSWCSQGDFNTWTPASGNTANSRTLTDGTKLVGGRVLGPYLSMVWSDGAAYLFQYTGGTVVYGSQLIARDCGLIAPNAVVSVNGIAYWMGTDNFFLYDGAVKPMPNVEDIRRNVYNNLDQTYAYTCTATYIAKFNEIWFSWTVKGQTNPTMVMVYSIDQQCWWPLTLMRHAGTHFTQGDTRPYIPATDGYLYQHENTNDNNGAGYVFTLTLAPYALSKGLYWVDVESIRFDFFQAVGNISITVNAWDYLNDNPSPIDTDTETWIPGTTEISDIRVSGRYAGLTISGSDLGQYWRWGLVVANTRQAGRRP
jgi:hypothetical protein